MSTTWKTFVDDKDPKYQMDLESGTGGVKLVLHNEDGSVYQKFWLKESDVGELYEGLLIIAHHYDIKLPGYPDLGNRK